MTKCDVPASIAFVLPQTPFRKHPETSKGLGLSQQPVFVPRTRCLLLGYCNKSTSILKGRART